MYLEQLKFCILKFGLLSSVGNQQFLLSNLDHTCQITVPFVDSRFRFRSDCTGSFGSGSAPISGDVDQYGILFIYTDPDQEL